MRVLSYFILSLFIYSCNESPIDDGDSPISNNEVIVSLQDSDGVSFVNADNLNITNQIDINLDNCSEYTSQEDCENSGCMWHEMGDGMSHCMMDHNHGHDMGDGMYQPHDIAVDNTNGYWFTTAMMGNKVAMYSIENNELIAFYNTSAMPALLSVDEINRKLYVSGGSPSMGPTNKILELEYNANSLELVEEWDVQFTYAPVSYTHLTLPTIYSV